MEFIKNHDRYLDPPAIPEYAECGGNNQKLDKETK